MPPTLLNSKLLILLAVITKRHRSHIAMNYTVTFKESSTFKHIHKWGIVATVKAHVLYDTEHTFM